MQAELSEYPNLSIVEASAEDVLFDNQEVRAVQTWKVNSPQSRGHHDGHVPAGQIFVGSETPRPAATSATIRIRETEPPSCGLAKTLKWI